MIGRGYYKEAAIWTNFSRQTVLAQPATQAAIPVRQHRRLTVHLVAGRQHYQEGYVRTVRAVRGSKTMSALIVIVSSLSMRMEIARTARMPVVDVRMLLIVRDVLMGFSLRLPTHVRNVGPSA